MLQVAGAGCFGKSLAGGARATTSTEPVMGAPRDWQFSANAACTHMHSLIPPASRKSQAFWKIEQHLENTAHLAGSGTPWPVHSLFWRRVMKVKRKHRDLQLHKTCEPVGQSCTAKNLPPALPPGMCAETMQTCRGKCHLRFANRSYFELEVNLSLAPAPLDVVKRWGNM